MTESDRDYIQSIERGFAVLLAFDAQRPNPTLAELATEAGLSRPAVRRILLTLQKLGYVAGSGGRWSLTPRVLSIGQHYSESHALIEAAMPRLLEVAEKTQESASLGVLDGADVVYAARVPVRRIMSINVSVGTRVPAYATSMGRALLAWAPADATAPLDYTRGTVAAYDAWANGEVYGYTVVAPDGRYVASCWDFYADPDEPITADAPPGLATMVAQAREEIDQDVEARTAQANTIGSGFIGLI